MFMTMMTKPNLIDQSGATPRRQWLRSGLATCGWLAAGGVAAAQSAGSPAPSFTPPGPVTARGRAPGLTAGIVGQRSDGEKTYMLVFAKGDEIMSGLTQFAIQEKIEAGYFTAIGALQRARFGWFDHSRNEYRDIPVDQQVELISLIGDIGLYQQAPQIHAHGAVGLPDGQMRGGHLLEAVVWPTLELFLTVFPAPLIKKHDAETNLSLFDLKIN
jgi:predicted DNA-binding protein with PD1-like motif